MTHIRCKTLSLALQSSGMTILNSRGDGHCLLYSVVNAWNYQYKFPKLDFQGVKSSIIRETTTHFEIYLPYFEPPTRQAIISDMNSYLFKKRYNTQYGDIVLNIVANGLNLNLHLFDEDKHGSGSFREETVTPYGYKSRHTIVLHRLGDHFNAIVPVKKIQHVLSCPRRSVMHQVTSGGPKKTQTALSKATLADVDLVGTCAGYQHYILQSPYGGADNCSAANCCIQ